MVCVFVCVCVCVCVPPTTAQIEDWEYREEGTVKGHPRVLNRGEKHAVASVVQNVSLSSAVFSGSFNCISFHKFSRQLSAFSTLFFRS